MQLCAPFLWWEALVDPNETYDWYYPAAVSVCHEDGTLGLTVYIRLNDVRLEKWNVLLSIAAEIRKGQGMKSRIKVGQT